MNRTHPLLLGAGLVIAGALAWLAGLPGPEAEARGRRDEHLRYAKTWAEAVHESRARGALIFATFHKDN